ncbi:GNAT family N-acetyltransferase [Paenibacillus sp. CAU 1782]
MGVQIIRPDETELTSIFELLQECRAHLEAQGIKQWDDIYPNMTDVEADFRSGSIYITKVDGEVTGVVSFDDHGYKEYEAIGWKSENAKHAILHRLSVRPRYQGRGIAQSLIKFVHNQCLDMGYGSIRLDVYSGNEMAFQFYKKLGYELRGEVTFPRRPLPFYCMEKELSASISGGLTDGAE